MKVIEVANKNHVSVNDVLSICKELAIVCEDDNTDITGNDIFLVEKRIETIKSIKAKEAMDIIEKKNEKVEGKKIKLKRKVHLTKELVKDKPDEFEEKPSEDNKPKPDKTAKVEIKRQERPRTDYRPQNKPGQGSSGASRDQRSSGPWRPGQGQGQGQDRSRTGNASRPRFGDSRGRSQGGPRGTSGMTAPIIDSKKDSISGEPSAFASKDSLSKRKKGSDKNKEKEKDKKFTKGKSKEEEEKDIILRRKKSSQKEEKDKEFAAPKVIEIIESISVGDLAKKLNIKASEVISKLMKLGVMATINQVIDAETAEILSSEYGTEVKVVSLYEETVIKHEEEDKLEDRVSRPPIVTVMGHVDHGKTRLLDTIRKTNVIDDEYGGITQHIGAYTVKVKDHHVTFLDTPGHEAFTTMRARGAAVTDIVILVVAANDGVMPQTIEAMNHAKAAEVPIIVAINKIDLPDASPDKVRQELSNYGLIPEKWGGTTLFAEISAKKGINIEELLDLIIIQSEMLELKANLGLMAKGTVIESKLDPGRGAVATILVQNGTLKVGDIFVVGIFAGKIRAMFNDHGKQVEEAPPSTPVEILGISGVPSAGDPFEVVESDKYAKKIAQKRHELMRAESAKKIRKVTLEDLNDMIKEGALPELRIIIKADVDGSAQALKESLEKLSTGEIRGKVIHSGTGGINESDVMLASASNAIIIGYHVRPTARVMDIAEREKVSIKFYNIIFEATNDVKAAMEGMLSPELKEEISGTGEVKQVFKVSKVGSVAGSIVLSGKIERKNKIRLIRDGVVIFDGSLKSLKRYKDDASEVEVSQECGFVLDGFNDVKEGDTFESYKIIKISKTLGD